jgi:hypothetical protein
MGSYGQSRASEITQVPVVSPGQWLHPAGNWQSRSPYSGGFPMGGSHVEPSSKNGRQCGDRLVEVTVQIDFSPQAMAGMAPHGSPVPTLGIVAHVLVPGSHAIPSDRSQNGPVKSSQGSPSRDDGASQWPGAWLLARLQ